MNIDRARHRLWIWELINRSKKKRDEKKNNFRARKKEEEKSFLQKMCAGQDDRKCADGIYVFETFRSRGSYGNAGHCI